jgi:hypothetical protein
MRQELVDVRHKERHRAGDPMRLVNTWSIAAAIAWAEQAGRALGQDAGMRILQRSADAWLFGWESASLFGTMGTQLAIGIRLREFLAVVLVMTSDDDGTELRTRIAGPIVYGAGMVEKALRDHTTAMKTHLAKMKRLAP